MPFQRSATAEHPSESILTLIQTTIYLNNVSHKSLSNNVPPKMHSKSLPYLHLVGGIYKAGPITVFSEAKPSCV